jgi:biopolymer transport protein ExbD
VPAGGAVGSTVRKDQVRTIEVSPAGGYVLSGKRLSLEELEQNLRIEFQSNPELAIFIRADEAEQYKNVIAILNLCERLNIKKVKFATRPDK